MTKKLTEEQWKDFKEAIAKLASFSLQKNKETPTQVNNIFQILRVEDFEIRHTNFLDWVFRNNHTFLREFLQRVCGVPAQQVIDMATSEFETYNPYKTDKGRLIDLVLDFYKDKYLIVIENKVYSGEGANQLSDYYESINQEPKYKNYCQKKFIYLTLNGVTPEKEDDKNNWQTLPYDTILKMLTEIKQKPKRPDDIMNILIDHYCQTLQTKIKENKNEMDLIDKVYELYESHKDLMKEIVKYIPNTDRRVTLVKEFFKENNFSTTDGERMKSWLHYYDPRLGTLFQNHGFPADWINFVIDMNVAHKITIGTYLEKQGNYQDFVNKYTQKFGELKSRNSDTYMSLNRNKTLIDAKEDGLTEKEFQDQIKPAFDAYFKSPTYQEFFYFVTNYFNN